MFYTDIIYEIRRRHSIQKQSISAIARDMGLSRPTVRKHLNTITEPKYEREQPASPKLGPFEEQLTTWLEEESKLIRSRRRSALRLFEGLQEIGYLGAYDSVQRYVKRWKSSKHGPRITEAFVPLVFQPGDACQFDWSQEQVELGGVLQTIKVAHFRLAYSRQMFVVAYPREMQEMVLDAHSRAFTFFGGVPARLIYDNLKTVVDAVFVGKERQFNRRFLTLANHYLFEPVACTPASGWEKGQVENQVGNVREWLFTPLARFTSFADLTSQDGVNLTILSQVVYRPFGGVQGYKNSAGQSYQRGFDLDGRISSYTLNNAVQAISYDAANRITAINEVSNPNRQISYGYDNTDRLTSYLTPQTNQNFTYDPVGNRRSKTNGTSTSTYSYDNTSNRLSQVSGSLTSTITMDANGSTTNNGSAQFAYDVRGRMISATTTAGVVQYQVNALGQRVQKTASVAGNNVSTLYHYDQGGHLISEQRGQSHVDYVYLDDIPVAVLK